MIWKHAAAARRLCQAVALLGVVAALGGCSEVPDAVNPVSWYHGVMGSGDEKPATDKNALSSNKSVPNADKPYPSIGTVPDTPPEPSTAKERAAAAKTLAADSAEAHYTDMQIRRQTDESAPAPGQAATPSAASSSPPQPAANWPEATPMPAGGGSNWPTAAAAPAQNVAPPPVTPRASAPPSSSSSSSSSSGTMASRPAPSPAPSPPATSQLAPSRSTSMQAAPTQQMPTQQTASAQAATAPRRFAPGPIPQVPTAPPPAPTIPTAPPAASAPASQSMESMAPAASSESAPQRRAATPEAPLVFGPPPPDIYIAETTPSQRASPVPRRVTRRRASRLPQLPIAPPPSQFAGGVPASVPASPYAPYFPAGVPFVPGNADGYGGTDGYGAADGYGGWRLATIYFRNGSARLGSRDVARIRQAVATYRARGGVIVVVGHASAPAHHDTVHSEVANFSISLDRANAVAREIMRLGVTPSAVQVRAVSDAQPAYYQSGQANAAASRRADILIE